MRRKNWINKKNFLFDRFSNNYFFKSQLIFNVWNADKRFKLELFLSGLRHRHKKYSRLNSKLNFFYFLFFINFLKINKRNIFFRTFYKIEDKNKLLLNPSFTFLSQYFEYRSIFFNILNINGVKGFFIYKNLFKNTSHYNEYLYNRIMYCGYNFYAINNNESFYTKINSVFNHKDYNNIGKIKYFTQTFIEQPTFNYYFLYNIYINNLIEIYKIIIMVYFFKCNK